MPFRETHAVDERIRFVCAALQSGGNQNRAALCEQYGIARSTGYYWLARYQQAESFTALVDQPRTPHHSPSKTPPEIEARVIALREQYGWGGEKLQVLLEREGVRISVSTVNRIIRRQGLVRREEAQQPAVRRFEYTLPNALWQVDFKARFRLQEGHCYPFAVLDDHSRFLLGLVALPSIGERTTYAAIKSIMVLYGVPDAILMDHGTPWWNSNSPSGLTHFSAQLLEQDIALHFGRFRHPQTQGKVEALNHALSRDMRHHGIPDTLTSAQTYFDHFRYEYNHVRPHQALDLAVPAEHYCNSARAYREPPAKWVYTDHCEIITLNSQGSMDYQGLRCFVAKPLARRQVGVQEVDGKLLVQYRGTYVREIDLATGASRAFLQPLHDTPMVSGMS